MEPNVWIVIPSWNRREDLLACLDSLSHANTPNTKILVVDNASEDHSAEAIETKFPNTALMRLPENSGAPYASNRGFEYALAHGADYVLRLDSDTIVSPNFLSPLIQAAEADHDIGILSPKIYYAQPNDRIWYAGVDAHPWHFGARNDLQGQKDTPQSNTARDVDYVWAAAMLIRRDVLEKTGGFDEDFFIYYEEVEFCQRVKKLGYRLRFIPESHIWHKVGSAKHTPWTAYQWNRSKMLLFRKQSENNFHKFFLIFYAFSYAVVDHMINMFKLKRNSGNRGPFKYALLGLWQGLHLKL